MPRYEDEAYTSGDRTYDIDDDLHDKPSSYKFEKSQRERNEEEAREREDRKAAENRAFAKTITKESMTATKEAHDSGSTVTDWAVKGAKGKGKK